MKELQGPEIAPRDGLPPDQLVILLHGYGSNGRDLIELAHPFSQSLPRAHFIAPDAPEICEISPFGFQWFSLLDRSPEQMRAGVMATAPQVEAFIEQQLERFQLTPQQLVLVGFSQGTMLSLQVGLNSDPALAGILGYSGRLLDSDGLKVNPVHRVMLVHGTEDDVVPYDCSVEAKARLSEVKINAELVKCKGLGHSIDQTGLISGLLFLKNCFNSGTDQ